MMDQDKLCLRIINVIRDSLLVRHRFLAHAFYALSPAPYPKEQNNVYSRNTDQKGSSPHSSYGTDGRFFYYDPASLLSDTLNESTDTELVFLHSCLHCLYRHPFIRVGKEDPSLWDTACDIHIACVMEKLVPQTHTLSLSPDMPLDSAQSIYRHLLRLKAEGNLSPEYEQDLRLRFMADDHRLWAEKEYCGDAAEKEDNRNTKITDAVYPGAVSSAEIPEGAGIPAAALVSLKACSEKWREIAGQVLMEYRIEAHRGGMGNAGENIAESLEGLSRRKRGFEEFMRRFAVTQERLVPDPDAFDYGYYDLGMRLYEDMPLIEPLEYREAPTIRTFVIAIDTSSSCDTGLVKRFLGETFGILSGTYFDMNRLCVHILQCDAKLQSDTLIESSADLEDYIRDLTVKGRGGTDFRPVFEAVDDMRKEGKLPDLKGLIYFTDGEGVYPSKPTDYRTVFVLAGDKERLRVPSWAMYTEFAMNTEF